MNVPLLDLGIQYASLRQDILSAITRVCEAQRFIMGPEVAAFESEVAAFPGATHAIGVSSGTGALHPELTRARIEHVAGADAARVS